MNSKKKHSVTCVQYCPQRYQLEAVMTFSGFVLLSLALIVEKCGSRAGVINGGLTCISGITNSGGWGSSCGGSIVGTWADR